MAHPGWLAALLDAMTSRPDAGMCASQVRLAGEDLLDSAGMLMCADGSSKQRGHRQPPARFSQPAEVLFPSASAALYRRAMLDEIGGFDEDFFLYSEDTDLGLRARWAGWKCLYVPRGRGGSPLLALGRPRLAAEGLLRGAQPPVRHRQEFPGRRAGQGAAQPPLARYAWHAASIWQGRGAAAQFRNEGNSAWKLVLFVLRAHLALVAAWPGLWRKRRGIRRAAKITPAEFRRLLREHSISAKEVAAL